MIGVSASPMGMDGRSRASLGDMELFVRRHNARYPHLFDAGLVGAQRYGVRSFPTLYVIDGTGTIRFAQSGEVGRRSWPGRGRPRWPRLHERDGEPTEPDQTESQTESQP